MYPILLKIGPIVIRSYGALVALGFLAGIGLALKRAKKEDVPEDIVLDLSLYILIAGILGARLFEVVVNFSDYRDNLLSIFKIWQGGLTFYGGLILAVITAVLFIRKRKLNLWKMVDIFTPSLALGHAIGKLGCFGAGCCYGKPTNLPWRVTFTHPLSLAPLGVPIHPTQLYSSIGNFVIFLLLLKLLKHKKFTGQIFASYIIMYSSFRFFVEFLRDDPRGFVMFGLLSISQFVGIILFITGIIMFKKLKRANI